MDPETPYDPLLDEIEARESFNDIDQQVMEKILADPVVETAALALDLGVSDFMSFTKLKGDDWLIAAAVVRRAQQIRQQRYSAFWKAHVEVLSKIFGGK